MARPGNVALLRHIIGELRLASSRPIAENSALRYVLGQFRRFRTTDRQLCRAQEEMQFVGNTYLCYLRSSRLYKELNEEFHGKGERSVAQTANMVGFKLPHDPK